MRRCPECRRDYYDDSLSFCPDDGSGLLVGPTGVSGAASASGVAKAAGASWWVTPEAAIYSHDSSGGGVSREFEELIGRAEPFRKWSG